MPASTAARTPLLFAVLLAAACLAAPAARAQEAQDGPSYQKEFTYGINLNSNAGLIGGVAVRSSHLLNNDWSRFWMLEGVEVKNRKEQRAQTYVGGVYVLGKSNYLFVLRPSVGLQRVIFRKAAESGVQVNGLVGAGPSLGLLMPYYIYYDYTPAPDPSNPSPREDIRSEQYDPGKHSDPNRIYDRAPLFTGVNELKPNIGAHLRGAFTFEYGRYRDAVAGLEAGVLLEAYTKRLTVLRALNTPDRQINDNVFSSVYVTLYIGQRK
ncbi:hypothetical protein D3Y59_11870 [Hymenobacter oligotrophus]|uniref:Uncharacterized protein n=1 Tax=Hymenobacter oligotrophus TaxID=2319843 RepID=A0A3B7R1N8_9BACT|nr:hypothetical protein [Hymenobacter oligotrophus]AYA37682.1 hypothetical protein D3Y59_11870 [Hymenobacter oligotrophus]